MTTEETKYYSAAVVFESNNPAPDYDTLYEEQVILLRATSQAEAEAKVRQYAEDGKHSYQNIYGETITITPKRILTVYESFYELSELEKGTEVYSRFFRDYAAYEGFERS